MTQFCRYKSNPDCDYALWWIQIICPLKRDKTLCNFMVNLRQIFGKQLVNPTRLSTHILAARQVWVILRVKEMLFPQQHWVSWWIWLWIVWTQSEPKRTGTVMVLHWEQQFVNSIISGLRKASEEGPNPEMNDLILHGVVYTGHKHRNTHSVCTEYMVSTHKSWIICSEDKVYLNAGRFNQEDHSDVVNKMFSETVEG